MSTAAKPQPHLSVGSVEDGALNRVAVQVAFGQGKEDVEPLQLHRTVDRHRPLPGAPELVSSDIDTK